MWLWGTECCLRVGNVSLLWRARSSATCSTLTSALAPLNFFRAWRSIFANSTKSLRDWGTTGLLNTSANLSNLRTSCKRIAAAPLPKRCPEAAMAFTSWLTSNQTIPQGCGQAVTCSFPQEEATRLLLCALRLTALGVLGHPPERLRACAVSSCSLVA